MYDVLRADRCISSNSLEGRVPFADLDFVEYALSTDPELKMNHYHKGKYLLRQAFAGQGYLPDDIIMREKAAFSDAVGHSLVDDLKTTPKRSTLMKTWPTPRKSIHTARHLPKSRCCIVIFLRNIPGKSKMDQDFWMPNKEWENCDVDDPSARVLKNYGASGE